MELKDLDDLYDLNDDEGGFRDSLATVTKSGKRIWIFPKKPKGTYYNYRKIVSYVLLAILFGLPWLSYKGRPLFLFNVLESKFILFGVYFTPQDFYLFVLAMLIGIVFIILFTAIFGRVFCGWVCPQTIFMEMVYRRIEYWIEGDAGAQKKLDRAEWKSDKIFKKVAKHSLFFLIAVLISNTFLAYIIGIEEVKQIIMDGPAAHLSGFISMIIFSFVFYFVFAWMREQVCTTICPYGRLQSVMIDDKSLAVSYDFVRGEPREKIRKGKESKGGGDCIDCNLCVKVCPTGIDIRDGIQLECVNCTACMDVCDEVMEKIERPKGLIRIDSLEGIKTGVKNIFSKRVKIYSLILVGLIILEGLLMTNRSPIETLIMRTPGTLYYDKTPGFISNLYNYKISNKSEDLGKITIEVETDNGTIEFIGNPPELVPFAQSEGSLFISIPSDQLTDRKTSVNLKIIKDEEVIDQIKTTFYGPN